MGQRPPHVKPPAHLSPSPPLPPAQAVPPRVPDDIDPLGLNPVRYGDWALKGIAIDF